MMFFFVIKNTGHPAADGGGFCHKNKKETDIMNENNQKQTVIEIKIHGDKSYALLYTPKSTPLEDITESIRCVYLEYMKQYSETKTTCESEDIRNIMNRTCRTAGWNWTLLVPNLTMTFSK